MPNILERGLMGLGKGMEYVGEQLILKQREENLARLGGEIQSGLNKEKHGYNLAEGNNTAANNSLLQEQAAGDALTLQKQRDDAQAKLPANYSDVVEADGRAVLVSKDGTPIKDLGSYDGYTARKTAGRGAGKDTYQNTDFGMFRATIKNGQITGLADPDQTKLPEQLKLKALTTAQKKVELMSPKEKAKLIGVKEPLLYFDEKENKAALSTQAAIELEDIINQEKIKVVNENIQIMDPQYVINLTKSLEAGKQQEELPPPSSDVQFQIKEMMKNAKGEVSSKGSVAEQAEIRRQGIADQDAMRKGSPLLPKR